MRQKRDRLKKCDACLLRSITVEKVINRVLRKTYNQLCKICLTEKMVEGLRATQDEAGGS